MTMPHLQNCEHQPEGWCLSCVQLAIGIPGQKPAALKRYIAGQISAGKLGEYLGMHRLEVDEFCFHINELIDALEYVRNKARTLQSWKLNPGGFDVNIGELLDIESRAGAPLSQEECPKCGCQMLDPFTGNAVVHDIAACSDGPGEEDGPWAEGWLERNRIQSVSTKGKQ